MDDATGQSPLGTSAPLTDADKRHAYIHSAILFADIENSVMLSSTLRPLEYDALLTEFQTAMQSLINDLRAEGYPIGEAAVIGDQLSIFFYDPAEVERNRQLDGPDPVQAEPRKAVVAQCRQSNDNLVFSALKAAILLKNRWLLTQFNLERVHHRREALGLGIGFHIGQVYLLDRPDGRRRIEGYAVNFAKRVEGYARLGDYSHIMLSQAAHDKIRGMVMKHTQLRQRVYFKRHDVALELLKGVTESQEVYELKFFSRIGIRMDPQVLQQYEDMFYLSPRNIWAYYQLYEHYAHVTQNWDKVSRLVQLALVSHPNDEKVLRDLSRYYLQRGELRMARELAQQALARNSDFDLVYEDLAIMANSEGDIDEQIALHCKALSLAPGSPGNHMNLGIALCEAGEKEASQPYMLEALRTFPEYVERGETIRILLNLHAQHKLPAAVAQAFGLS